MELSLSNIINIQVTQPGAGLSNYNTSNVALFTSEVPAGSFGTDGYKIYLEPTEVITDFGSGSNVAQMATAIFAQQPNIKANNGYLVVILTEAEVQSVSFPAAPVSGSFVLQLTGGNTAAIDWDDTASDVQSKIRAVTGYEDVLVTGSIPAGLEVEFAGVSGDIALMTIGSNTLSDGVDPVVPVVAEDSAGEELAAAITRTAGLVQYFGIMSDKIESQTNLLAAAAVVQALNKMAFFASRTEADVEVGGKLDLLRTGGFSKSRGLYYGGASNLSALLMMAAYVGRGLSVNFGGDNTTLTMHLKDLATIQPDPSMTQAILTKCQNAGADVYASFQGVAKVYTSGANEFFDDVYNLGWFVGALEVAGFNLLAQVGTKIPQTEQGMDSLKSAYRQVCEQARRNQFLAGGAWTSPVTFGNQLDFYANISQLGYYIYSTPVALQSVADREDRKAPLVQIAAKYAGAIHSSTVIVNINK